MPSATPTCPGASKPWSVSHTPTVHALARLTRSCTDIHGVRVPRPRVRDPEPRARVRARREPDAARHRRRVSGDAARARVRRAAAGGLPDGGARGRGHDARARARGWGVCAARGAPPVGAQARAGRGVGERGGGDGVRDWRHGLLWGSVVDGLERLFGPRVGGLDRSELEMSRDRPKSTIVPDSVIFLSFVHATS
jgi:hypothetical protein